MPKKILYLHIGRHKTGTSSLQQFLSQNRALLAERGILYPETGRHGQGKTVHIAHHNVSETIKRGDAKAIRALKAGLSAEVADYKAFVLSSEDFQNIDDFDRLRYVFGEYKIHVICYLREYLSYLLSSFAQRIHNTGDVLNISAYVSREQIALRGFIQNWSRFADHVDFRLYERSKLKSSDIVTDFLDMLGHADLAKTETDYESNPSLSGNVLALKMLLNLMGQSDLIPYQAWAKATELDASFTGKVYVDDETAFKLRAAVPYNSVLRAQFPDVTEASFEGGARLFDLTRWDEDMARLAALPAFKSAQFFPVSQFGSFLDQAGLSVPALQFEGQIKDVISQNALIDKTRANRLKSSAESSRQAAMTAKSALISAEDGFRRAQIDLDNAREINRDLSLRLKTQTEQAAKLRKILNTEKSAKTDFQKKLKQQTHQASKLQKELERERTKKISLQKTLKTQTTQAAKLRKTLDAEKSDKTDIQRRLKEQTGQAAKLRKTLDAEKTAKVDMQASLTKQIGQASKIQEKLEQERNLKLNFQEKLKAQTEKAAKIHETLQKAKAEAGDLQNRLEIQTAQTSYFRGENFREKGDYRSAVALFEKAESLDPENDVYSKRVDQCRTQLNVKDE